MRERLTERERNAWGRKGKRKKKLQEKERLKGNHHFMDLSSAIHDAERPKLSIIDKIDEDECSITDLGDALLGLILSYLPTKDAVKTSVLAKIWQHQWMSISNLEFREEAQDDRALFVNFVERVLLLRESSAITKFFLECGVRYDSSRISSWVSTAVKHKVQELDLCFREIREPLVLPRCVFTCKSLLQLKIGQLNEIYDLKVPSSVCFSSLKILTLRRVRFPDDYSAKTLLSGCPVLEELNLIGCCWDNVKAVCISGSRLKNLTIKEMCIKNGICYHHNVDTEFVICGVKLEYFCYSGSLNHNYGFSHSSSAVNVSIETELRDWILHHRAFKLLMGLSYTKSLHVCLCVLVQVLSVSREMFSRLPVFSH
ncbi:putative FBD-associated F-box protein At5g56700 isoform X1 [Juglans microcarpa x Juglans regia]|uniref:putative FBD-associated F-box protein At5g56700 isoform X1 n=2 Tax=Juglans microcarpa x Juglans regia TaxID=2249226 RepID=UPI001B7DC5E4|nr:putative FBD-associated F-box protein At5g56700 isoform X1 [Juglans microcarpa x Juglans regia]